MNPRLVQAATLALVIVGALALVLGGTSAPERSEHAAPAQAEHMIRPMPDSVVVTPNGKLFHDPSCTHVHGPAESLPLAEAERRGYTPCPWCLPTGR